MFDGKHEVIPNLCANLQDAVLADTYKKTLKAQFIQLRRWACGASDVAYVAKLGFFTKNKIPKHDVLFKFLRLLEGHVSWATSPLILAFAALVPVMIKDGDFLANQLPLISSRIQTAATAGILVTLFVSFKMLPPKPLRYKRRRTLFMILQWCFYLLPLLDIARSQQ